jgi:hypothetical protein
MNGHPRPVSALTGRDGVGGGDDGDDPVKDGRARSEDDESGCACRASEADTPAPPEGVMTLLREILGR